MLAFPEPSDFELLRRIWQRMPMCDENECWEWQGVRRAKQGNEYPYVRFQGRLLLVTRVVFEQFCGPVPEGMKICHTCDNPPCINPNHFWLGTQKQNIRDAVKKERRAGMRHSPKYADRPVRYTKNFVQLTAEQEADIVVDSRTGHELAKIYGVHRSTIDRARKRRGVSRPNRRPAR